jgi:integrase
MTGTHSTQSGKQQKSKVGKPKFPLFLHSRGYWAKKVNGRLYYFGKDRDAALERWIREKDDLLAGRTPKAFDPEGLTLLDLCTRFLSSKESERDTGEITPEHWNDLKNVCQQVLDFFGKKQIVESLYPEDFARLRSKLAKGKRGKAVSLKTLENSIARIRVLFNYAAANGLIQKNMSAFWGTEFKKPNKKAKARAAARSSVVRMFTPEEIRDLLEHASPHLKAMILIGINCGLGNTDIGQLERHHIRDGWLSKPRSKTGKPRRNPLWPETIAAIEDAWKVRPEPKNSEDANRLFITKYGSNWIPTGKANPISAEFAKVRKAAKVKAEGKSFYTLRHCFQTIGDETLDFVAVRFLMGHDGTTISSEYREGISDERLRKVTDRIHAWLFGGAS